MPRVARLIVGVVLASFAGVYVLAAPARTDGAVRVGAAVALVAVVLGVQIVRVVSRDGRWRWGIPVQVVAAYAGVLAFGTSAGVLGFVVGSLLLAGVWPGAVIVVGSAAFLGDADVTITCLLIGLVVFGLVRLADRADDTVAARLPLTMAAVARERLRIAAELNRGLGEGLREISEGSRRAVERPAAIGDVLEVARRSLNEARAAAADFRSMSLAPEASAARALLEAADVRAEVRTGHSEPLGPAGALLAMALREAVTDVVRVGTASHCLIETWEDGGFVWLRVVNDGVRTAALGEEALGDVARRVDAAGGAFSTGLAEDGRFVVEASARAGERPVSVPDRWAYRLSVGLLAAVLAGFSVKGLLQVPWGIEWVGAAVLLVLIGAMQLLWASSGRPKVWVFLLAVLSVVPVPVFGKAWLGLAGFFVGTLLVGVPRRFAVPLTAATMAGVGAGAWALDLEPAVIANYVLSTLVTGLVVYGLVWLARLVPELREAGEELARAATVQERLRAARDLHDLLGHSLAAILLKCELARRLADVDPARARAELHEVVAMAERAGDDLKTATGGGVELSLGGEADSARSVLAAAGVEVETDLAHGELADETSAVLSTVLREAVTNVLRHSAAKRCVIMTGQEDGVVRLVVENDGLDPAAPRTPPGSGIGNLTTRLASFGGTLSARADGLGKFRVEATVGAGADRSLEESSS